MVKDIEESYHELHIQCKKAKFFKKDLQGPASSDRIIKYLYKKAEYYPVGSKKISKLLDISDPFYNEAKYHLEVKYNFTLSFDSDSTQELVVDDTYYKLIGNIEKSLLDVKENYCKNSISLSYVLSAIIFVFCTVIYFFGAKKFFDYKKNNTKNDGSDRIEIKKDKINDDNKKTNNERYINLYNLEKNAYVVGSPVVISAGALLKDTQNDTIIVQLKMTNICNKEIKAVQIIVDGTDSFG